METKFNFNSQICTDRNQSERLLALGLKKETADMCHRYSNIGDNYEESVFPYSSILALKERMNKPILGRGWEELYGRDIPAWSLHRLKELYKCVGDTSLWNLDDVNYDRLIQCIGLAIKHNSFNKEYLV